MRDKIKDMLKKIVKYQLGMYPKDILDRELTKFIKEAEEYVCRALEKNGFVCYRDYRKDYSDKEARDLCMNDYRNAMLLSKTNPRWKFLAEMILVSLEIADLDKMSLSDKILLFDKLIHFEHYSGELFDVDVPVIKAEVDIEILMELNLKRT